jgi:uncharacterized protein (TIGR00369 family)
MVGDMHDAVAADVDGSAPLLVTPHGGPELLFRLGRFTIGGGTAAGSMAAGPWLVVDGRPAPAAIAILLDDVLGQAVITARPAGYWAVTTELTLDFCAPLPVHGQLHATAAAVVVDGAGGMARGTLCDDEGVVVAVGSTWQRFIPGVPDSVTADAPVTERGPADPLPADLVEVAGEALVLAERAEFANPNGVTHGGVLAWAAELAAHRAVAPTALATASLHVQYVRPAVGPVSCTARPVHAGRSLAVVEVELRGRTGKTCARATVTLRSASLG